MSYIGCEHTEGWTKIMLPIELGKCGKKWKDIQSQSIRDENNRIKQMYNSSPFMSMNRLKKRIGFRKKKWARSFMPTLKGFLSSSFRCVWTDKRRSFSISLHNLSSKCYSRKFKFKKRKPTKNPNKHTKNQTTKKKPCSASIYNAWLAEPTFLSTVMCNTDETIEESFALVGPHKSKWIYTWNQKDIDFLCSCSSTQWQEKATQLRKGKGVTTQCHFLHD